MQSSIFAVPAQTRHPDCGQSFGISGMRRCYQDFVSCHAHVLDEVANAWHPIFNLEVEVLPGRLQLRVMQAT